MFLLLKVAGPFPTGYDRPGPSVPKPACGHLCQHSASHRHRFLSEAVRACPSPSCTRVHTPCTCAGRRPVSDFLSSFSTLLPENPLVTSLLRRAGRAGEWRGQCARAVRVPRVCTTCVHVDRAPAGLSLELLRLVNCRPPPPPAGLGQRGRRALRVPGRKCRRDSDRSVRLLKKVGARPDGQEGARVPGEGAASSSRPWAPATCRPGPGCE